MFPAAGRTSVSGAQISHIVVRHAATVMSTYTGVPVRVLMADDNDNSRNNDINIDNSTRDIADGAVTELLREFTRSI